VVEQKNTNTDNKNFDLEVELIKRDISMLSKLCEKFDLTIEKLQTLASDISRIVYLQEQRMGAQDKTNLEFDHLIEKGERERLSDLKDIQIRIQAVHQELNSRIHQVETTVLAEMKALKNEMTNLNKTTEKRVGEIDAWRYMVMGAIALGVFLLGKALDIGKFFV
jgi:hypothetical protein